MDDTIRIAGIIVDEQGHLVAQLQLSVTNHALIVSVVTSEERRTEWRIKGFSDAFHRITNASH